jgi:hypothetical protein
MRVLSRNWSKIKERFEAARPDPPGRPAYNRQAYVRFFA